MKRFIMKHEKPGTIKHHVDRQGSWTYVVLHSGGATGGEPVLPGYVVFVLAGPDGHAAKRRWMSDITVASGSTVCRGW